MDAATADILCALNDSFYRNNAASFCATRKAPWPGWTRSLQLIQAASLHNPQSLSVFDLACGNLRFKAFLDTTLAQTDLEFYAVDKCAALLPDDSKLVPGVSYHWQNLDILDALKQGLCLSSCFEAPACDLTVCFGFMHHVPLPIWRRNILAALLQQTKPGGYLVVSFWQFLKNDKLAAKARKTHQRALAQLAQKGLHLQDLNQGDFLLGWQDAVHNAGQSAKRYTTHCEGQSEERLRYCHSFSDQEISELATSLGNEASILARFACDGRSNNLNSYLIAHRQGRQRV